MEFERAYLETGPKIVGYLVATGTGEAAARDILHDAVRRAFAHLKNRNTAARENAAGISALLFATARNLRANAVRDGRRETPVAQIPEDAAVEDGRRAAERADAAYLRRRITAALASLPEALRETYVLRQIGGRSVREIAAATGASETLVKVRLHRAKKSLRETLADLKE